MLRQEELPGTGGALYKHVQGLLRRRLPNVSPSSSRSLRVIRGTASYPQENFLADVRGFENGIGDLVRETVACNAATIKHPV